MIQNIQCIPVLALSLVVQMNFAEAIAQAPTYQFASQVKFVPPPPPPDRGAAGNRDGAASRGCGEEKKYVMALVPAYEHTEKISAIPVTKVWGLTASEHPTFWFFVPHSNSSIAETEFVLKDESNKPSKTLYQTLITPPQTPGIVSIHLPSTTASLQIGKIYHWFFKVKVKCDPQKPAQEFVEGWVQRVSPNSSLVELLKQATPQQQVGLYAENGIWYDALTTLAELRLAKPNDAALTADWTSLLNSVGREKLTTQPLVNCCSSK